MIGVPVRQKVKDVPWQICFNHQSKRRFKYVDSRHTADKADRLGNLISYAKDLPNMRQEGRLL
jgi:hypothetical protein